MRRGRCKFLSCATGRCHRRTTASCGPRSLNLPPEKSKNGGFLFWETKTEIHTGLLHHHFIVSRWGGGQGTVLVREQRTSGSWGPFRFTVVTRGRTAGFCVRCRFHRKNERTDCKMYISFDGDDTKPLEQRKAETARRLATWCLAYSRYDRQRKTRCLHSSLGGLFASP